MKKDLWAKAPKGPKKQWIDFLFDFALSDGSLQNPIGSKKGSCPDAASG
jgi:hypothetical protein